MRELATDLREKLGKTLERDYGHLKSDYEYIIAGLNWLSFYAHKKGRDTQFVFGKTLDIKIRKVAYPVDFTIMLADETDGVHGIFTYKKDKMQIGIQMEMVDLDSPNQLYNYVGIIRMLQSYLGHELMHCYQYISKINHREKAYSLAADKIPQNFSYLYYFLQPNELEAVAMSAYTQYRRLKKRGWSYLTCLLRTLDYTLSSIDNKIENKDLTPFYLTQKYILGGEFENLFLMKYMLGVYIPRSRFYSLCEKDENYETFVDKLKTTTIVKRKLFIDKIYEFLENILDTAAPYRYIKQAFYLIGNTISLGNICKSTEYAIVAYKRIATTDFSDKDKTYDEEEDTVVHGRPDTLYDD